MAIDIFEYAKLGQVYHVANTAAVTLSALSVTATGIALSNPFGSGKNLALLNVAFAWSTAPGGSSQLGIAMSPTPSTTAVTHTTPLVVRRAVLDGSAGNSVGLADSSATTIGTPVFVKFLGGINATASVVPTVLDKDLNGSLIVPPGCSVQLAYVTTAIVGTGSLMWLEYKA